MLIREEIFWVWKRLKQIKCNNLVFGGLCVVLVGNPEQLPPVQAENLWVIGLPSSNIDDRNSNNLYKNFNDAVV